MTRIGLTMTYNDADMFDNYDSSSTRKAPDISTHTVDRSVVVGCIMAIVDHQKMEDGRLMLLVHSTAMRQSSMRQCRAAKIRMTGLWESAPSSTAQTTLNVMPWNNHHLNTGDVA